MSTRAAIIAKIGEKYHGIYLHNDGYPSHTGTVLRDHYTDPAKVAQLIALGDLSEIKEKIEPAGHHSYDKPEKGVCVAYCRDRGSSKSDTQAIIDDTPDEVARQISRQYTYVFDGQKWTCNGLPINQAIAKYED